MGGGSSDGIRENTQSITAATAHGYDAGRYARSLCLLLLLTSELFQKLKKVIVLRHGEYGTTRDAFKVKTANVLVAIGHTRTHTSVETNITY